MAQAPEFLAVDESTKLPVICESRHGGKQALSLLALVFGLVALVAVFILARNWMHAQLYEDAPNAVIESNIFQVGPRISGVISEVLVRDNEWVKKEQPLAKLDNKELLLQQAQAENAVKLAKQQSESARLQIAQIRASAHMRAAERERQLSQMREAIATGTKQIKEIRGLRFELQAQLKKAGNNKDAQKLMTAQRAALAQKEAMLNAELAKIRKALNTPQVSDGEVVDKQLAAANQQYAASETAVKQAELELEMVQEAAQHSTITSPVDGLIAKKALQVGQRVQPGQPVVAIVQPGVWVTANMNEGQVARLKEGQLAEVRLASLNRPLFGKVVAISPVVMAAVAEQQQPEPAKQKEKQPPLQQQNQQQPTTVVARYIPVRIEFFADSLRGAERAILPGMSAQVSIKVRDRVGTNFQSVQSRLSNAIQRICAKTVQWTSTQLRKREEI